MIGSAFDANDSDGGEPCGDEFESGGNNAKSHCSASSPASSSRSQSPHLQKGSSLLRSTLLSLYDDEDDDQR